MFSFFKRSSKKEPVENGTGSSASIQKDAKRAKKDLAKGVPVRVRSRAATDENSAWSAATSSDGGKVAVPVVASGPAGDARVRSETTEGVSASSSVGSGIMARPVAALRGKGKGKRKVTPNSNGSSTNSTDEQQLNVTVSQQGQSVPNQVQSLNNQQVKKKHAKDSLQSENLTSTKQISNQQVNSAAATNKLDPYEVSQKNQQQQGKGISSSKENISQSTSKEQPIQVQLVKQEQNISTAKIKKLPEQSTQLLKQLGGNMSNSKENLTQKTLIEQTVNQQKQNISTPKQIQGQKIIGQQETNASSSKENLSSKESEQNLESVRKTVTASKEDLTQQVKSSTVFKDKSLSLNQPQIMFKQPQQSPPTSPHHGPPSFKPKPLLQQEKSFVQELLTEAKQVHDKVLKGQPTSPSGSPTVKQSPSLRRTVHFAEQVEEIEHKPGTPPLSGLPKQPTFLQHQDSKSNLVQSDTIEIEFPEKPSSVQASSQKPPVSSDQQQPSPAKSIPQKPAVPQRLSSVKKEEQVIPLAQKQTKEQINPPLQQNQANQKDNQNSILKPKPQISAKPQLQQQSQVQQTKPDPNVLPAKPAFLQPKQSQPLQIPIEPLHHHPTDKNDQPIQVPQTNVAPWRRQHSKSESDATRKQLETQTKAQTQLEQKVQENKEKLSQKSEIAETKPKHDTTPLSSPPFYRKKFEQNKEQPLPEQKIQPDCRTTNQKLTEAQQKDPFLNRQLSDNKEQSSKSNNKEAESVQAEIKQEPQKQTTTKPKLQQQSSQEKLSGAQPAQKVSKPLTYTNILLSDNKEQLTKSTSNKEPESIQSEIKQQPQKQIVTKPKLQQQSSQEKLTDAQPVQKVSKPLTYTNILRNLEQHEAEKKKSALSVKPCSHVTIAASPRTPPPRADTSTPPESPLASSKTKPTKTDEPVTKDDADTITAAMKLRVDLQHTTTSKTNDNTSEKTNTLKQSSDVTQKNIELANDKAIINKTPEIQTVEVKNKSTVQDNKNKSVKKINEVKKLDDKEISVKSVSSTITKEADNNNKTKNLVNQEARFQSQLAELTERLRTKEEETNKLRFQMEDLQRDLYVKSSGVDRLQAELLAAHKDSECVRNKLKLLQSEIVTYKQKNAELIEEVQKKTEEYKNLEASSKERTAQLESSVSELTDKLKGLETQIDNIKQERDRLEKERANLEAEREEEKKIVQEALEAAMEEKESIRKRWEDDFEKLRTVNTDREQQMLDDFEWKLREVQQMCKKRLDEKEKQAEQKIKEVQKDVDAKMKHAQEQLNEVARLKSYEAEVTQLRGLTNDQQRSLRVMSLRADELQLAEQNLKDEISRLHGVIQDERNNKAELKRKHEKDLADNERTLQIRMDKQRGEIAVVWEQKLRQECARLKSELDQMHTEEKNLAVELIKFQKEQEYEKLKEQLEQKVKDCMNEITNLKNTICKKDEKHQIEIDRIRTNADRDIVELRRELDKGDMAYHERIEKILEQHERELERINEETERRVKEMEQNCQMQVSSMRATLELVKEQMERESQDKIQQLIEEHQKTLDQQWERLTEEKNEELNRLEKDYKTKFDRLREQFAIVQKNHQSKELELTKLIEKLKGDMNDKVTVIEDLQNNVDTLQGGVQVLNEEIANQDQKFDKMKVETDTKIGELQHALKVERESLQVEREEHIEEITHLQKQSQTVIEQLQRKCQCLTKLFEEMRSRYDRRDSRPEDLKLISDLRSVIAEQEKDLAILNEEKRYFQMELMKKQECEKNRQTEVPRTGESSTTQEQTFKGGGSCGKVPENNDKQCVLQVRSQSVDFHVEKSENLDLPTSL